MVESQVRPSDVTDRRILRAMLEIERERFLPEAQRALAYMDGAVRLPGGRDLMDARTFAKLAQLLDIDADETVLIVGAGGGYSTAVLSRLAKRVVALECDPALAKLAETALGSGGDAALSIVTGALEEGYPTGAPYDAILVEGAVAVVPQTLLDQLKDGGRLAAISAGRGSGQAKLWRRQGRSFGVTAAFDAAGRVLPGLAQAPEFSF